MADMMHLIGIVPFNKKMVQDMIAPQNCYPGGVYNYFSPLSTGVILKNRLSKLSPTNKKEKKSTPSECEKSRGKLNSTSSHSPLVGTAAARKKKKSTIEVPKFSANNTP